MQNKKLNNFLKIGLLILLCALILIVLLVSYNVLRKPSTPANQSSPSLTTNSEGAAMTPEEQKNTLEELRENDIKDSPTSDSETQKQLLQEQSQIDTPTSSTNAQEQKDILEQMHNNN